VIYITKDKTLNTQICKNIITMQKFWDQRYAENETVYGSESNKFFKLFVDLHKPGTLLLPAEGKAAVLRMIGQR